MAEAKRRGRAAMRQEKTSSMKASTKWVLYTPLANLASAMSAYARETVVSGPSIENSLNAHCIRETASARVSPRAMILPIKLS